LINDPLVGRMNETQWYFELESLRLREEERLKEIKEILDIFRAALMNMLGLDLMPFRNDDGTLRRGDFDNFTPLSVIVGRREWLKELGEKMEEFIAQEDVRAEMDSPPPGMITSLEELEQFEADVRKAQEDGDVHFPDDPEDLQKFLKWNSAQSRYAREKLVQILDDEKPESEKVDGSAVDETEQKPRERRVTVDDA